MPAKRYTNPVSYHLKMEETDKSNYDAAATRDGLTLVDWINRSLRETARKEKLKSKRRTNDPT